MLPLSLFSLLLRASSGYPNGYPVLGNSRGGFTLTSSCLWSHIVIRVFLLLGTVCLRHPPYLVLPFCPLSRVFPYPQPGDADGRRSGPAVYQSLTSADPSICYLPKKITSMYRYTLAKLQPINWNPASSPLKNENPGYALDTLMWPCAATAAGVWDTGQCTGWLKIKYPTRQYAISSQPVVRF